jgi:ABC-type dipeptide/oligopeptide/nickel transport system permease subunit
MWRLLLIVLLIICAPWAAPYDPLKTDVGNQLQAPGELHLFGTDLLGRDVLSRFLHGGQRTLVAAGMAALIAILPGILAAFISAGDGTAQRLFLLFLQAALSIPNLLLALVVLTVLGRSEVSVMVAVGIGQSPIVALVIRAAIIAMQSEGYLEAAHAAGAGKLWIATRHILPNLTPTLVSYSAITLSYCLLNNAALNFLGLGAVPGVPEWGVMLAEGRAVFRVAPWVALSPGFAITAFIWFVNRWAARHGFR